jgi:hypothetical protein
MGLAFKAVVLTTGLVVCALLAVGFATATDTIAGQSIVTSDDAAVALITSTRLRLAYNSCGGATLADGDHTMIIDTPSDDAVVESGPTDDGTTTYAQVSCILQSLDTPQSVISQLDATSALDGMQTGTWQDQAGDSFSAKWTYHPDNGLDLIITEQ